MSGVGPHPSPPARCVLWHPRGTPPGAELIQALEQRRLAWSACDAPLDAIARTLTSSNADGPGKGVPTVLLLVDPAKLHQLGEVLDLIVRYRPKTAFWVFDPGEANRIRSMQNLEIMSRYVPTTKPLVAEEAEVKPAASTKISAAREGSNAKETGYTVRLRLTESFVPPANGDGDGGGDRGPDLPDGDAGPSGVGPRAGGPNPPLIDASDLTEAELRTLLGPSPSQRSTGTSGT